MYRTSEHVCIVFENSPSFLEDIPDLKKKLKHFAPNQDILKVLIKAIQLVKGLQSIKTY